MDISDLKNIEEFEVSEGHVGHVAIVGRPNVGKSTLINQLMDYHLTAVSPKPQTTRRHWQAIYCDNESQIVFIDTPGIHEAKNKLGETMLVGIDRQLKGTDIVLCMVAPSSYHGEEEELLIETLQQIDKPVILTINKVDESNQPEIDELKQFFKQQLGDEKIKDCVEISALNNTGIDKLLDSIKKRLPQGQFVYDPDYFTDATEREIVTELIQEAVFCTYQKEIPHAMTVTIDSWNEDDKKIKISATIFADHERLKKIIIGKNGNQINEVKRLAIEKIRENIDKRIDLKLFVKINKDWRNSSQFLDSAGFR